MGGIKLHMEYNTKCQARYLCIWQTFIRVTACAAGVRHVGAVVAVNSRLLVAQSHFRYLVAQRRFHVCGHLFVHVVIGLLLVV